MGYATEAIRLISRHAFETLGLYKLTAGFYASNIASIKAFKSAGFKEEGLVKAGYFLKGKREDGIILGMETNV